MNEPTRLRELSENELESALLGAGTDYRSSPRTRAKTLAALGVAGSAALGGTALATEVGRSVVVGAAQAAKLTGKLTWKLTWLKTLIGVPVLTAAVAVPATYALRTTRGPAAEAVAPISSRAPEVAPPPVAPAPEWAEGAAEPARAPSVAIPVERAESKSDSKKRTADARRAARRTTGRSVLTRELAMLDAARSSVAAGNPVSALSLLDTYDTAFAGGVLRLEAEVVRVEALAKSGQTDRARERAQKFLRQHPASPLARKVRVYAATSSALF